MADSFELGRSKKEQLEELKRESLEQKKKVFKFIPGFLHKYIDYINSLKIKPKKDELSKSLGFSAFFSFVVWANQGARSAFMYYLIGNLVTMSMMLQRGMPKMKLIPGQRRQVGSWSSTSFTTALCLSILFTVPVFLITFFTSALIPGLTVTGRGKAGMIVSLFAHSFLGSQFEVFEEKSKNGSRWRKAIKGYLEPHLEAKLNEKIFSKQSYDSYYIFPYDPEVDEAPYKPRYLDELPGALPLTGQGDLDETESRNHFENWKTERQNARRPPVTDVPPETPWVGGKAGMFVKPPEWLSSAYVKGLKKVTKWRGVETKYKKDFSEFVVATPGPFGFRDKHPDWLDAFDSQPYMEQLSISRQLARAFGTYRKTMWKIDKEVQLQACDGADKEKEKKNKK